MSTNALPSLHDALGNPQGPSTPKVGGVAAKSPLFPSQSGASFSAAGGAASGGDGDDIGNSTIPLYCKHSPKKSWRATLRRLLFPRTHSAMEVFEGRPALNSQKTIMIDWLDYLVILLVVFTSVLLCLQDPLDPDGSMMRIIAISNNVLGFMFSFENVLRLLCFGFIYFKADYWNIFDSLIVATSLVTTIVDLVGSNRRSGIEALRIFILFRPLRSIRFIDTARITMIASIRAFKSIGDVGVLLVLFLVLVATSGVTQYNSRLTNRCFNEAYFTEARANGSATENFTLANYTRFQAYDMLRVQALRKEVEYRQCGYRYKQYQQTVNTTVCTYQRTCTINTTIDSVVQVPGGSNTTPASTYHVAVGGLLETFEEAMACTFLDGSVVCSKPSCREAPDLYRNRTLLVEVTSANSSANAPVVATRRLWPLYLSQDEADSTCGTQSLDTQGRLVRKVCVFVNPTAVIPTADDTAATPTEADDLVLSAQQVGYCRPYLDDLQANDTVNGTIAVAQTGPAVADISLPLSTWTIDRSNNTSLVSTWHGAETETIHFPGASGQWCRRVLHDTLPKNLALSAPWWSPNVTNVTIAYDCVAVNQSVTASPRHSVCCGRNASGFAVCCATTNRRPSTEAPDGIGYPADPFAAVCCSAQRRQDEGALFLQARAPLASGGPGGVVQVLSIDVLADSLVYNASTCTAAIPTSDTLLSRYRYGVNRSSADPGIVFYSKQQDTWAVSLNWNATQELMVASCVSDTATLTPAQLYAYQRSLRHLVFPAQRTSSGTGALAAQSSPFGFAASAPPISFHLAAQRFNVTSSAVNQSSSPCTTTTMCYSMPFDTVAEYACGDVDGGDGDGTTLWTAARLQSLPPYDAVFRGMERAAIGPLDWQVFSWKERNCDNSRAILLDGYKCPFAYECIPFENPYYGKLGFENLPQSMLTDFSCITRESWYDLMYRTMDAVDQTAAIYFVAVIIVGALFITNLMIVLLTVEFDSCVEEERRKLQERRVEAKKQRKLVRQEQKKAKVAALAASLMEDIDRSSADGRLSTDGAESAMTRRLRSASDASAAADPFASDDDDDDEDEQEEGGGDVLKRFGSFLQRQLDTDKRSAASRSGVAGGSSFAGTTQRDGSSETKSAGRRGSGGIPNVSGLVSDGRNSERLSASGGRGDATEMLAFDENASFRSDDDDPLKATTAQQQSPSPDRGGPSHGLTVGSPFDAFGNNKGPTSFRKLSPLQKLRKDMRDRLYSQTGLIVTNVLILGNMIVLGAVYYGMSDTMRDILDLLNFVFTVIFTVELSYRLFCIDIWNFVRSTMSMLDLVVVIVSWIDFAVPSIQLPIIRGVRVIRLLNVFKPFPNVYKWIKVITRSLKSSVILFIMCSFFAFVFAVFGMSLFGGRFCDFADANTIRPDDTIAWCSNRPRSNYDTLVQALLTSFQIMTGDDWHLIMVNGMRARGDFFALFFVANYVIGNMILLNLLIGILLSVRTATDEDDRRRVALSEKKIAQARAEADWGKLAMLQEREEWKKKRFALIHFKSDDEKRAEAAEAKRTHAEYSKVELLVQRVVETSAFRYTVLVMIIVNTIGLALESPFRAPDTPAEVVLRVVDLTTNIFFVLELMVECVAYGIFLGPKSYLRRDSWNVFDLVMVCVFLVTQLISVATNSQGRVRFILRGISSLRALRPIRFVAQSKGMRLVIKSLVDSIGPLGNLLVVILIVMTLFGIMGVQIFQGLFYTCNGTDPSIAYINLDKTQCEDVGGRWMNAPYHFDHLGAAYMTLFVLSTMEGWSTIMFNGMDATDAFNAPPIVNIQKKNAVYFIAFVVIGSIFFVNLFVSIIIDSFQQAQRMDPSGSGGTNFLTKQQNAWIRSQHTMLAHVAVLDYDGVITTQDVARSRYNMIRRIARFVARHPLFDVFIYCCIFVNFLVMAVEEYPQSDSMDVFGRVMNIFFTAIFVFEVIIRVVSESPRRYLASKWNRFDLIVVFLSLLALLFELIFANATFVAFFRSMRAIRLLRLLRKSRRLQAVLRKFLVAMYSLTNIGGILFLVLFCYGLVGMKLFGRVVSDGTIDHNANFQDIFSSFLMMLRVATGGNWGDVLKSCTQSEFDGYCLQRLGDCGLNVVGQLFFVSFVVIATFVLLNVFVAVILDVFTSMTGEVDILSPWDASQFMKLWFHFDPERTYRMESRFLLTLLRHIPPTCVIGMGHVPKRRRLQHELVFVESLQLDEADGKIELQDLIQALCDRAFRKVRSSGDPDDPGRLEPLPIERARLLKQKMDRHFRRKKRDRYKPSTGEPWPVVYRVAVQIITAYWERRDEVKQHLQRVRGAAEARTQLQLQLVDLTRSIAGGAPPRPDSPRPQPSQQQPTLPAAAAGSPQRIGGVGSHDGMAPVPLLRESISELIGRSKNTSATTPLRTAAGGMPSTHSGAGGFRSNVPPSTGLLSSYRVVDGDAWRPSGQSLLSSSRQQSIADALFDDEQDEMGRTATGIDGVDHAGESLTQRLVRRAQDPNVRQWSEAETLAIARVIADRRDRMEKWAQCAAECRMPEEEAQRRAIAAEEAEMRQFLSWKEVQDVGNVFLT